MTADWLSGVRRPPGPGPGLLVVGVALFLVGAAARVTPTAAAPASPPSPSLWPTVPLPGALPPVPALGLVGLGVLLGVLVLSVMAPHVDDASRVLLTASSLGALGPALLLLRGPGGLQASRGSALTGLAPEVAAVATAALVPVVVHLAVLVTARRYGAPSRAAGAAGSALAVVTLVVCGVGPGSAGATAAAVTGALLLAVSLGRRARAAARAVGPARSSPPGGRTPAPDGDREGQGGGLTAGPGVDRDAGPGAGGAGRRRTDLLPSAGLGVAALVLLATSTGAASGVVAVLALLAAGERLGRWRARGHLEVLARCLGGTVLVEVGFAVAVGDLPDPAGRAVVWRLGVTLVALAGVVVAARLPRPVPPAYTRATHLRVVRGSPWAVAALLAAAAAAALPPPPDEVVVASAAGPRSPRGSQLPSAPPPRSPEVASSPRVPGRASPQPVLEPAPAPADAPADAPVRTEPPVLAEEPPTMRVGAIRGTQVDVVVRSAVAGGPVEVRTRIGGNETSYPLVTLAPATEAVVTVVLPLRGRFLVTLHDLTSPLPLRELVVDR